MIQPDSVKAVFEREYSLDFVRLDHCDEYISDLPRLATIADQTTAFVISNRQDRPQIIRRMPPFSGKPSVVEIEPSNHRSQIECSPYGIELITGSRHLGAAKHRCSRHNWT